MNKTFKSVETTLEKWAETYNQPADLHCVISRKAPRLYECVTGNQDIQECPVVSEFAIPHVINKDTLSVNLADDAIYFGSTFEKVYGNILTAACLKQAPLKKEKIKSFPVVASKSVRRLEKILNIQSVVEYISEELIPFYVDTIISKFYTLNKPYDIEFPIICCGTTSKGKSTFINSLLQKENILKTENKIKGIYEIKNYCSEKDNVYVNYTVLIKALPDLQYPNLQAEFQKIRIFLSDDKISFVSYAPSIIPDEYIVYNSPLFTNSMFSDIWNMVYNSAYAEGYEFKYNADYLVRNESSEILNKRQWDMQLFEFEQLRKRSLVVFANYLLSFGRFLNALRDLDIVFSDLSVESFKLEERDVAYLLGWDLGKKVSNELNLILQNKETFLESEISISEGYIPLYIPEEFREKYNFHLEQDYYYCDKISQRISSKFSIMHRFVEIESRKTDIVQYDRLRFGESFTSIYNPLMKFENFEIKLHHGIDKRIDGGSIVPNYICLGTEKFFWGRYFRPGENEDRYKDQLGRFIIFVVDHFMAEREVSQIPCWFFHVCFIFINLNIFRKKGLHNLCGVTFYSAFKDNEYMVKFNDENNESYELLDYAINSRLLEIIDNNNFLQIVDNSYTNYLRTGLQFDQEIENEILECIGLINSLLERMSKMEFRNLFNFYFGVDMKETQYNIVKWKEKFIDAVDRGIEEKQEWRNIEGDIFDIFVSFPNVNFDLQKVLESIKYDSIIQMVDNVLTNKRKLENNEDYKIIEILLAWSIDVLNILFYRKNYIDSEKVEIYLQDMAHYCTLDKFMIDKKHELFITLSAPGYANNLKEMSQEDFSSTIKTFMQCI